jgi:hypothetical protein
MITIELKAGLGNQLFQLAFLEYLSVIKHVDAFLTQHTAISPHSNTNYLYSIFEKWIKQWKPWEPIKHHVYESTIAQQLPETENTQYHGHFQYHQYVTDKFIQKLTFPTKTLSKYPDIHSKVFIHIRGGDYLEGANQDIHHVKLENYYLRAIEQFPTDTEYVVFTNDLNYAMTQPALSKIKYTVINEPEIESMYLMSQCKGGICANSTFSWWGGFLNRHRKIILPSKWFVTPPAIVGDLYFPQCTVVDV